MRTLAQHPKGTRTQEVIIAQRNVAYAASRTQPNTWPESGAGRKIQKGRYQLETLYRENEEELVSAERRERGSERYQF